MTSFLMSLVSFFLLQPVEQAITAQLASAQAPPAIVQQVVTCTREAAPAAVDRVTSDPVWAVSTAFGLWMGSENAETVLIRVAPSCDTALQAARPFLRGTRA
ncbi:hypothetical protein [Phreatobacter sp.]|uniref:hypothetical protein n=1 Tax=Phreatobacter sp. TaxID=1966341 RepID=UPI0025D34544|nr:hypothetical protein [Phreatobacter sp.]